MQRMRKHYTEKKDRVNGKYAWVCRQHDFGIDKCASKPIDDAFRKKSIYTNV